jgi:hypothetical protein
MSGSIDPRTCGRKSVKTSGSTVVKTSGSASCNSRVLVVVVVPWWFYTGRTSAGTMVLVCW